MARRKPGSGASDAKRLLPALREVAHVIGAVAKGDLSQRIPLKTEGTPLKGEFLSIARTLRQTTRKSTEQDWLKTNLAKFTQMLQGQRDLMTVAKLILSELAPNAFSSPTCQMTISALVPD